MEDEGNSHYPIHDITWISDITWIDMTKWAIEDLAISIVETNMKGLET